VRKFCVSGMSPVAADLASAASAEEPCGAAAPPVAAELEAEAEELVELAPPQPDATSRQIRSRPITGRDREAFLSMRGRVPPAT
jgi:hypothetical protein